MTLRPRNPIRIAAILLVLSGAAGLCVFGTLGCGDDNSSGVPGEKLCQGESGVAARIAGESVSLDMCVSDGETVVDYIPIGMDDARYHITAILVTDTLTIEIQMTFFKQPAYPVTLTLTSDRGLADSDPGLVWFYYQETKPGVYDVASSAVTGVFTVTFNDPTIAVAVLQALELELDEIPSGNPAGARTISEGYVSVTVE